MFAPPIPPPPPPLPGQAPIVDPIASIHQSEYDIYSEIPRFSEYITISCVLHTVN